ncbi:MAG: ABC transporter permease subunit [Sedimentisphaerales bacterium]|nr:ABC transporter permease subunit [Sedimentisphaerales bacterium]
MNTVTFYWLTGPIFDKELRVASRRRRNYVFRSLYLLILTLILILFWVEEVRFSYGSASSRASRMYMVGMGITAIIIWAQFCTSQIIGVIMLSTSISDEIYSKTLGALMTTPINSMQIVLGKLLSGLLQILVLIGVSFPLLAIVRVFGGVPWQFLLSGFCITMTAVIFVGSLCMFFSIFCRRAYVVIILTILTLAALFLFFPLLTLFAIHRVIDEKIFVSLLYHLNPYFCMGVQTEILFDPRSAGFTGPIFWPLHCGILLILSSGILLLCVVMVRRAALRQIVGASPGVQSRYVSEQVQEYMDKAGRIRRVWGPPVVWKELLSPLTRHKTLVVVFGIIGLGLLIISYGLFAEHNDLDEEYCHILYGVIFFSLGLLVTLVFPATTITTERESRTWPALLGTAVDDWNILLGKVIGTLKRCLPAWLPLFGHIWLFTLVGYIHPAAMFQISFLVFWTMMFLIGSGLYFSGRFKRTTTAVVMNFILGSVIWALVPFLLFMMLAISHSSDDLGEAYMDLNPYVHLCSILDATARQNSSLRYDWLSGGRSNFWESSIWMLLCGWTYIAIGVFFAWRAKCRFRKNIFH